MSVTSVSVRVPRTGEVQSQRKGLLFEVINRKYVVEYLVTTNSLLDGPQVVLNSALAGVPQIGNNYLLGNDSDILATCVDVRCDPHHEIPTLWVVRATFDTERLVGTAFANPLNQPAQISWTFNKIQRPLVRDGRGIPVVTSSMHRFDPPVEYPESRPVLVVRRNEATFNQGFAFGYQDAVNSDIFAGEPALTAKVLNITGELQVDIGLTYWNVRYEVEFRRDTHIYALLDQDFLNANNRLFRDPLDSSPLNYPTLLNGRGWPLSYAAGTLGTAIGTSDQDISVTVSTPPNIDAGAGTDIALWPPLAQNGAAGTFPPDGAFQIQIDSEILTVYDSASLGGMSWQFVVLRGVAGSIAGLHNPGSLVKLQPYYRQYLPGKLLPFLPLGLPV